MQFDIYYKNDGDHGQTIYEINLEWIMTDEDDNFLPERYFGEEDFGRGYSILKITTTKHEDFIKRLIKRGNIPNNDNFKQFDYEAMNFDKVAEERVNYKERIENSKSYDEDKLILNDVRNLIDTWLREWDNKINWLG
jgi:uncharacterized protein (DUF2126 family)